MGKDITLFVITAETLQVLTERKKRQSPPGTSGKEKIMIEKYKVRETDGEYLQEVVDIKTDTVAGFSSRKGAIDLCTKLNRLAALEKVCGEIIKDPTEMDASGDETDYDYGYTEGAKYTGFLIAQKLKAVLEEK